MSSSNRISEALAHSLGGDVLDALGQPGVTEVLLNPNGQVWFEDLTSGLTPASGRMQASSAENVAAVIAAKLGRVVNGSRPVLEGELELDGSRITVVLPPVVSSPVLAVRKVAECLFPLEDYLRTDAIAHAHASAIRAAIRARQNIVISGGPGSGKTTFANALIHEMEQLAPETERFILIEDTYELRCEAENHVVLHTTDNVTLRDLVKVSLRLRPDRIIVGEVRSAEALDLLKAWNTGNPGGVTTVHANSAGDALHRLDQLAQEAGVPSQAWLVASSVDMVVHMERRGSKRQVTELITVKPFKPQTDYIVEAIPAE